MSVTIWGHFNSGSTGYAITLALKAARRAALSTEEAGLRAKGRQARGRECFRLFQAGKKDEVLKLVSASCLVPEDEDTMIDYDVRDDSGMTILHHACRQADWPLIHKLLDADDGPKLSRWGNANVTAFSIFSFFNSLTYINFN